MTQEKNGASELFYSFLPLVKPRQVRGSSVTDEWLAHVLPYSPIQALASELWHGTGVLLSAG